MSGFWKVVSNAGKTKTGQKIISALTGGSKTSPTITSVPISSNLTKKFKAKQDIFKAVDEAAGPYVSSQKKSKIKIEAGKKVSKIFDKKRK